ncbi:MAG TPA: 50S ribosomal protein L9 [Sphingobacteriaceae bacterium]|nr:50S ribosomal protein L9 [Sphingobacteriaceae bacterium]
MKVILLMDHEKLGKQGEVVTVKPGYARNYLVPQGLAVPATKSNLKNLEQQLAAAAKRVQRELNEAQETAGKLSDQTVTVTARAGAGGRLFGSITAQQVAEAINQAYGTNLDRRRVHLPEPLRQVGTHQVELRLHPEVRTQVNVEVVAVEG